MPSFHIAQPVQWSAWPCHSPRWARLSQRHSLDNVTFHVEQSDNKRCGDRMILHIAGRRDKCHLQKEAPDQRDLCKLMDTGGARLICTDRTEWSATRFPGACARSPGGPECGSEVSAERWRHFAANTPGFAAESDSSFKWTLVFRTFGFSCFSGHVFGVRTRLLPSSFRQSGTFGAGCSFGPAPTHCCVQSASSRTLDSVYTVINLVEAQQAPSWTHFDDTLETPTCQCGSQAHTEASTALGTRSPLTGCLHVTDSVFFFFLSLSLEWLFRSPSLQPLDLRARRPRK